MAALLPFEAKGLRPLAAELDELRGRLDARGPLVIAWEGQLRRDLEAASVQASVAMEGVPVTLEQVRHILAGDPPASVAPDDADLVRGYREAMVYVQSRADDPVLEWDPELVKAIHHRVLAGRPGAGRYGGERFVVRDATGELVFTPPQEGVDRLVAEVCERMNAFDDHPAVRAAWVHVAVAAVHPFKDGNGRTARVLAALAMYRGGFRRPELCSLEEWWGRHRQAYDPAFACLGSRFDRRADVTPFIRAHLEAQRSQVRALALSEETNRRVWDALGRACERAGLPDRAAFALWDAYNAREITRSYYRAVTDVGDTSATSDFNGLRAAGLLVAQGRTRGRRYVAGPRLYPAIAEELAIPGAEHADRSIIVGRLTEQVARSHAR